MHGDDASKGMNLERVCKRNLDLIANWMHDAVTGRNARLGVALMKNFFPPLVCTSSEERELYLITPIARERAGAGRQGASQPRRKGATANAGSRRSPRGPRQLIA